MSHDLGGNQWTWELTQMTGAAEYQSNDKLQNIRDEETLVNCDRVMDKG